MKSGSIDRTFLDILRTLNHCGVRYLVAGGIAVILHGVDRLTHDLDLYIDLDPGNIRKAAGAFVRLGFRPLIPVPFEALADPRARADWIRNKNMKVFQVLDPRDVLHPVDLFVIQPVPYERAWKRRVPTKAGRTPIPLISIPDLIRLKEIAGRDQDLSDIISLKRLRKHEKR